MRDAGGRRPLHRLAHCAWRLHYASENLTNHVTLEDGKARHRHQEPQPLNIEPRSALSFAVPTRFDKAEDLVGSGLFACGCEAGFTVSNCHPTWRGRSDRKTLGRSGLRSASGLGRHSSNNKEEGENALSNAYTGGLNDGGASACGTLRCLERL
jgi:hypothetical protein